jgi:hypothetical protein
VPLVLARFAAATPLNTELSVVFKIVLFAVDKEEIPKVILPEALVTDNLPKSVVLAMMML